MLKVALIRRFAGIIAPSAPANLLDAMRKVETAIILTEGFGELRMNSSITSLLQEHDGHQVTLSAVADNQYDIQRPEIVINRTPNTPPPSPNYHLTLRIGMQVRIVRALIWTICKNRGLARATPNIAQWLARYGGTSRIIQWRLNRRTII
jgi:hypothetical protein